MSASWDHTARIWNTATGDCQAELKGHSRKVNSAVFSPDGGHVLSASDDCTARIWNTATGECQAELKGHSQLVNSAVFSPDGRHIVSASDDNTVRIWDTATGDCQAELKGHSNSVNSAVFSPDGRHIVSASDDHTARIWNTATGECQAELKGHLHSVEFTIFSPDGRHVVCASWVNIKIWNTATGHCQAELHGYLGCHNSTLLTTLQGSGIQPQDVLSPDSMHVVSASYYDHTIRICSTATGDCQVELNDHSDLIDSAVFSSHGVFVSHGSYDRIALSLQPSFLDMYKDTITHTKNLQQIWIPPIYCHPHRISHHLSKICLAYGSGDI